MRIEAVREQFAAAEKRANEEFERVKPEAEKELQRRQAIATDARQQIAEIREAERLEQRQRQQQQPWYVVMNVQGDEGRARSIPCLALTSLNWLKAEAICLRLGDIGI